MSGRRASRVLIGLAALGMMVVLIAGVPVLLYRFGGSPIPSRLPTLADVAGRRRRPDGGSLFLDGVREFSWIAWAYFTLATATEARAAIRGRGTPSMVLPGVQGAAGRLVALVMLAFTAPAVVTIAASPALAATARVAVPASQALPGTTAATGDTVAAVNGLRAGAIAGTVEHAFGEAATQAGSTRAVGRVVVVQPGDCLWVIAQRYLGSGERYREITALNIGHTMDDGRVFTDPALIQPGWRLEIPPQPAAKSPAPGDRTGARNGQTATGKADPPASGHHSGHQPTDPPSARRHPAVGDGGSARGGQNGPSVLRTSAAGNGNPGGGSVQSESGRPTSGRQGPSEASQRLESAAPDDWAEQAGIFGLGLLAGGILVTLERLRRRQRQDRQIGRRIAAPTEPAGRQIERRLRAAAQPTASNGHDLPSSLESALRGLSRGVAESGMPPPRIIGVHLTADSLDVLLSEPSPGPPPPPFAIAPARQGMCWSTPLQGSGTSGAGRGGRGVDGSADFGVGDLLPGLVTAGTTEEGYLLLDLEELQVTSCEGPAGLVDRMIVTAATELACGRAGWLNVVLVGCDGLEVLGTAQRYDDLDAVISALRAHARTVAGRLVAASRGASPDRVEGPEPGELRVCRLTDPDDEDWMLTLVVSRVRPTPEQMSSLLDLADGPGGIAVLAAGDVRADDGRMAPCRFQLSQEPDHPGEVTGTVTFAHLGPARPILVRPQLLTAAEYEALNGVFAAASVTADVAAVDPPYDECPPWTRFAAAPVAPEPAQAAGSGVRVAILGPVEISGAAEPLQHSQAELVLALALHTPLGLTNSELCGLLGADADHPRAPEAIRQLIARTRRRLGPAPDGRQYILHQGSGVYTLHPDVTLDWTTFAALAARGLTDDDPEDLTAALSIVRGQPFGGRGSWWIDIGLIETVRAEVVDVAQRLAGLELDGADPVASSWAAKAGLAADSTAEQLWRALMTAEHAMGNRDGIIAAWTGCLDAITEIDPDGEPHPVTRHLFHRLSGGVAPVTRRA